MRKALFVFTGKVWEKNSHYYSLNLSSETLHKLYFPHCQELDVCMRLFQTDSLKGLMPAESDDIRYHCTDIVRAIDMYLLKRSQLEKFIEERVKLVDFVIARQSLFGCIAAKYAKKYHKPYIYEVVGSTWDSFWHHSFSGKILAPYMEHMVKKTIMKAQYVTYVTDNYLQKRYPTIGENIGISDVEINEQSVEILKQRLKRIKNYKNGKRLNLVTVAGVNVRAKGQIYVIKALAKLKAQGIYFDYYLVGEGDQGYLKKNAIKFGIIDQIHFVGALPHHEVLSFLEKMDIYIQPSLHEGLPRAVVEAMSMAMPCIGSRTAGIPELLEECMLFEKKDLNRLFEILKKIKKEQLQQQASRNFEFSKNYTADKLKIKRDEFYVKFMRDSFRV